ncbi:MAG: hypothetical protein ACRDIU_10910, partial [Actinomycetota bacterium]
MKTAIEAAEKVVADLDPAVLHPDDAMRLVSLFAKGKRIFAAGELLASRQVDRSGGWQKTGERSAAASAPSFERELLNAAQSEGISGLKRRCRAIKASSAGQDET